MGERQQTLVADDSCAGEPTGIGGLDAALVPGEIAGLACAGKPTGSLHSRDIAEKKFAARLEADFRLRPEVRSLAQPKSIVCRREIVPCQALATRSGWTDSKLQTRRGMGPCQGRICGPETETLFGWTPMSIRPPLTPVPVRALLHPPLFTILNLLTDSLFPKRMHDLVWRNARDDYPVRQQACCRPHFSSATRRLAAWQWLYRPGDARFAR